MRKEQGAGVGSGMRMRPGTLVVCSQCSLWRKMANDFVYQTAARLAYSEGVSGGEWACQGKFINLIRGLITLDGALISINLPAHPARNE